MALDIFHKLSDTTSLKKTIGPLFMLCITTATEIPLIWTWKLSTMWQNEYESDSKQ